MPHMSGKALFEILADERPEDAARMVFLTGYRYSNSDRIDRSVKSAVPVRFHRREPADRRFYSAPSRTSTLNTTTPLRPIPRSGVNVLLATGSSTGTEDGMICAPCCRHRGQTGSALASRAESTSGTLVEPDRLASHAAGDG